ncbi:MAG: ChaN family lipoprotein [Bacteroidales bacterium]|nr:ChaN family lipoprotein [Bacteroidales bacterium]MDT8372865.1 ChaN family lipoprotein [Bacteroidales bacterium]
MKTSSLFLLTLSLVLISFRSDKPAYKLYDNEGKKTTYQEMIETVSSADVIFFGELHDNPISHWLEYEVTADLFKKAGTGLVLGAEMFEADDQLVLDEYLSGRYESDKFEAEVKLWKNYKTDYKPLVEFARKNSLPFIATNIPRRYASMVSRDGLEVLDSLTAEAKSLIAPLPMPYDPELKCYKDMMSMHGMPGMGGKPNVNLPKSQAAKDATMAHFIVSNLEQGRKFIHYNGAYHSENYQGIIYYLQLYRPGIRVATITTVLQNEIETLHPDNTGLADCIIAIPQTMTRTY